MTTQELPFNSVGGGPGRVGDVSLLFLVAFEML